MPCTGVPLHAASFPIFAQAAILEVCMCVFLRVCVCERNKGKVSKVTHFPQCTRAAPQRRSVFLPGEESNGKWNDSGSLDWDCLQLANLCKWLSWLMWRERERESQLGQQSASCSEGFSCRFGGLETLAAKAREGCGYSKQLWQRDADYASPLPGKAGGQTANQVHGGSGAGEWHGMLALSSPRLPPTHPAAPQLPRMIL